MRITEHAEQVALVSWMRQAHPDHWIFAIPNGGARIFSEAKRLKLEGVSPGVPDLFIPSLKLFIEMKRREGGRESADQAKWRAYLNGNGYRSVVCRGCKEAIKIIDDTIKSNV